MHSGKFLTGIFVSYDKKTKDLEYINAGHLNCIVSENQKITEYISKKTQPLGIEPFNSELKTNLNQISLEKKIFYLFSDGLYESKDFEGKEIKIDGLINLINKNKEYSLDKQLDNIFIEISTFGALQNILEEEKSIFGNIVSDQIEKYKSEDFFEKEKSIIKDDITIFAINGE